MFRKKLNFQNHAAQFFIIAVVLLKMLAGQGKTETFIEKQPFHKISYYTYTVSTPDAT